MLKSYLILRSKQEFMQANVRFFRKNDRGAFNRAGAFIRNNMVCRFQAPGVRLIYPNRNQDSKS